MPTGLVLFLGVVAIGGVTAFAHGRGLRLPSRRGAPAFDPEAWARLVAEVEALPDNDPEPPATLGP